ncbi:MAG: SPOR domain-containing protein [Prevotella sp.]|nr:SPOR domain-containing protein [Prevotella sp.]
MIALDRHIEILLLSNDCVIVPGFGGFVAHHIDARKDESDGSFLPPLRSIAFNPKLTINDSLLAQSYVEAYDISYPEATMRIEDEVRELRQRIETNGSYTFNGIGTISLNAEGNYEFSPCEAGILTPDLYGLGSFKTATLQELRAAILARQAQEQALPFVDNGIATAIATNNNTTEESDVSHNGGTRFITLWRNVAAACVAIVAFLLIPSPLVNNTQQLQESSIDTRLLDHIMPKDITTGQDQVIKAVREKTAKAANNSVTSTQGNAVQPQDKANDDNVKSGYAIVLASHVTKSNANAFVEQLHQQGIDKAYVYTRGRHNKVLYGCYANESEARSVLNRLNSHDQFEEAWITYVK